MIYFAYSFHYIFFMDFFLISPYPYRLGSKSIDLQSSSYGYTNFFSSSFSDALLFTFLFGYSRPYASYLLLSFSLLILIFEAVVLLILRLVLLLPEFLLCNLLMPEYPTPESLRNFLDVTLGMAELPTIPVYLDGFINSYSPSFGIIPYLGVLHYPF